jgi:hypothetical protein
MHRRSIIKAAPAVALALLFPNIYKAEAIDMAILGQFILTDYTSSNGLWNIHFVNLAPGGGNPNDYYIQIPESELPANINQTQLAAALKNRLGWTVNQTFAPLNTAIAANLTITLP